VKFRYVFKINTQLQQKSIKTKTLLNKVSDIFVKAKFSANLKGNLCKNGLSFKIKVILLILISSEQFIQI
jgi:hypothetical protein